MENKSFISGFIVSGGKSRQMGNDQAFLMFDNEPLLKRMINLIEPFCGNVAISG